MELHELLRHVADNTEAGRPAGHGLLYMGEPSRVQKPESVELRRHQNYELAPNTVVINGIEVTAGVEDVSDLGAGCILADPTRDEFYLKYAAAPHTCIIRWAAKGIVFPNSEEGKKNAIAMAKAMLNFHYTVTHD